MASRASGRGSGRGGRGRGGRARSPARERTQPALASDAADTQDAPDTRDAPVAQDTRDIPDTAAEEQGPGGFDGNRDPAASNMQLSKNIDAGVTVWSHMNDCPIEIPARPKPSTLGREISMGVNTFNILSIPTAPVYQYSVKIGSGTEKPPVVRKVWASGTLRAALPRANRWIFNGHMIAWSTEKLEREIRLDVDLDAEEGRQPASTAGGRNSFKVEIRPAATNATIRFDALRGYLDNKADFSTSCLEAINFLDHLLRESPSQRLTAIKRSFFQTGQQQARIQLSPGVDALKGVYQSIRFAHSPSGKHGLSVNVDVANGAFWTSGLPLAQIVGLVLGCQPAALSTEMARPQNDMQLKKLRRVGVVTTHRGQTDNYIIDRFLNKTARTHKFAGADGNQTTVEAYFAQKYNRRLQHPDWPLVQMTKKSSVLPLEVLTIGENQRFMGKLDDRQTSNMIRAAVTLPAQRWSDIKSGMRLLNWSRDPYLNGYGLQISEDEVVTKGRLIPNPKVTFANGDVDPRTSGRWRVDGKRFLTPNKHPLRSWGVCIPSGGRFRMEKAVVEAFMAEFIRVYKSHGGRVESQPYIHVGSNNDPPRLVEELWTATGNKFQQRPQILLFCLAAKDSFFYGRVKKTCECRYGVVSQCLQYTHIQKKQAQYISNVCLKFNAKLGGSTARAVGQRSKGPTGLFTVPTLIMGADVNHPAPKSQGAATEEQAVSIAAITVSTDAAGTKYACGVNSNGYRVEIIQTENWTRLWKPLVTNWMQTVGGGAFPKHIIYFRDGVSEGQFAQVVRQEVADMKALVRGAKADVKFVVICCVKRHHLRMFPRAGDTVAGDKNGNPVPGVLLESAVTHPFENNWLLCSHSAIKGTARPTMYHVLMNEPNLPNEMLQTLVYEHCYQFVRSTTPVSLVPAAYYADIAAGRATSHTKQFGAPPTGVPKQQQQQQQQPAETSSSGVPSTVDNLMPMPDQGSISTAMWWV